MVLMSVFTLDEVLIDGLSVTRLVSFMFSVRITYSKHIYPY